MDQLLLLFFVSLSAASGGAAAYLAIRHARDAFWLRRRRKVRGALEQGGLAMARAAYATIVLLIGGVVLQAGQLNSLDWRLYTYMTGLGLGAAGFITLALVRRRSGSIFQEAEKGRATSELEREAGEEYRERGEQGREDAETGRVLAEERREEED